MTKPVFLSVDDAALLERVFTINEPEKLEGIVETVPHDWSSAVIEGEYDLRGQKREPAKCAHPGRHRHRVGYVCLMPDGSRFMVGKDCGKKKHGADLTRMRRVFDARKDRQYYLSRLARARPYLPDVMTSIRLALESDCFDVLDRTRAQFRAFCGDSGALLSAAVIQNGGTLMRYEKVRDHAEEERRKSNDPIFKHIETPIGVLRGREFIAPKTIPKDNLKEAQALVREVFHATAVSSHLIAAGDLRALSNKLDKALDKAFSALETLSTLSEFMTMQNLRLVAAGIEARAEKGGLTKQGAVFTPPHHYSVPDTLHLKVLFNGLRGIAPGGAVAANINLEDVE